MYELVRTSKCKTDRIHEGMNVLCPDQIRIIIDEIDDMSTWKLQNLF